MLPFANVFFLDTLMSLGRVLVSGKGHKSSVKLSHQRQQLATSLLGMPFCLLGMPHTLVFEVKCYQQVYRFSRELLEKVLVLRLFVVVFTLSC